MRTVTCVNIAFLKAGGQLDLMAVCVELLIQLLGIPAVKEVTPHLTKYTYTHHKYNTHKTVHTHMIALIPVYLAV